MMPLNYSSNRNEMMLYEQLFKNFELVTKYVIVDDTMFRSFIEILTNDDAAAKKLKNKIKNNKLIDRNVTFLHNNMIFQFAMVSASQVSEAMKTNRLSLAGVLKVIPAGIDDGVAIYVPLINSGNTIAVSTYCSKMCDKKLDEYSASLAEVGLALFSAFECQFNAISA